MFGVRLPIPRVNVVKRRRLNPARSISKAIGQANHGGTRRSTTGKAAKVTAASRPSR